MSIAFSDTTNKNGLMQILERRTGYGDAGITGDSTLKKQFTSELNLALDEVTPLVFASDSKWQWDDANHTKMPIGTTTVSSGVRQYSFTADEDGNSILEVEKVYYYNTQSAQYEELKAIDISHDSASLISADTGRPTAYDKLATAIILNKTPNETIASGLKIVFKRAPSYFVDTDTTKTPGIPSPFHALIADIAARNWLEVNKSEDVSRLAGINIRIERTKLDLTKHLNRRSKDEQTVIRPKQWGHR